MKFLQKLGKALMLPVAVLPICGILMGIGYLLCPATMQGGDIEGAANLIGLFLVKAGGALIDHMPILFAIGVGVGMSDKNDGTGGIAALASWLMMTTLLSTGFVTTIIPSIADSEIKTIAFDKIENPFIGILAGIIGAMCYNKFKNTKLPDWLSFFSGKRCVAIIAGVVSILVSVVLLFVWPLLFSALVAIGKGIVKLDVVGAGIYAFLNRLLIPTGLHHALNNVFWFDTIGLGDLQHFWAGETSADVSWSLGMYMSGFFPCMMFGIPGAACAMIKCAKPAKKKIAIGIVASAAICAFVCGVTEPFEFAFMFLAPGLYVIYALLYGLFTIVTVALGFQLQDLVSQLVLRTYYSQLHFLQQLRHGSLFLLVSQHSSYSTLYSSLRLRNLISRLLVEKMTTILKQKRTLNLKATITQQSQKQFLKVAAVKKTLQISITVSQD